MTWQPPEPSDSRQYRSSEEALGAVLLCAGLALRLEVSFLLAAVVMGAVATNAAKHHVRTFPEIQNIEAPFLVVFFVLAGASVSSVALVAAGGLLGAYLALRAGGKLLGSVTGSWLVGLDPRTGGWFGAALLPQAGVALGMALVASEQFPAHANTLLSVAIVATLVFELVGPVLVKVALHKVGEME